MQILINKQKERERERGRKEKRGNRGVGKGVVPGGHGSKRHVPGFGPLGDRDAGGVVEGDSVIVVYVLLLFQVDWEGLDLLNGHE
jgi:hypothetical protein